MEEEQKLSVKTGIVITRRNNDDTSRIRDIFPLSLSACSLIQEKKKKEGERDNIYVHIHIYTHIHIHVHKVSGN